MSASLIIEDAFKTCETICRSHYENFPIGWFVPKPLTKYVYAIYAFARTADDYSDEAAFEGQRLEKLNAFEESLKKAERGEADEPIFIALVETFKKTKVPPQLLHDLLTAFKMDLTKKRYQTHAELEQYCVYSANPVGRMVLLLFGYDDPQLLLWSDKICTGIQLVNHWQDIGVDLLKDRVYLPEEDLKRYDYSYTDLFQKNLNKNFKSLLRYEISKTRALFEEGKSLIPTLEFRLRLQIALMWLGPMDILRQIEKNNFDVFDHRPKLGKKDLFRLLFQYLIRGLS